MDFPITADQANYLNLLARVAKLYRLATARIAGDLETGTDRISKGRVPSGIRTQDMADIMTTAAQLDVMTSGIYSVFPSPEDTNGDAYQQTHRETVNGYVKAAMTLADNDYIMMKH